MLFFRDLEYRSTKVYSKNIEQEAHCLNIICAHARTRKKKKLLTSAMFHVNNMNDNVLCVKVELFSCHILPQNSHTVSSMQRKRSWERRKTKTSIGGYWLLWRSISNWN